MSIYSSINPCIYHLFINYPSIHSHMYLSSQLCLSIFLCTYHLSISCTHYLCICHLVIYRSMFLSSINYPSIHSSIYPSIHPPMYLLSIIYTPIIHPSLHLSVVFVNHTVINFLMPLTTCCVSGKPEPSLTGLYLTVSLKQCFCFDLVFLKTQMLWSNSGAFSIRRLI